MAKFSRTSTVAPPQGPTSTVGRTVTHEGGQGHAMDAKTELYTLAVCNMVRESTFYESANDRDNRFRDLIHQVAQQDPGWVAGFIPWLRNEANMRSASVVAAVEYVRAKPKWTDPAHRPRAVLASACSRPDEPAEILGYWLNTYGRGLPQPIKRGTADAANRLYNQRSALKYDGGSRGVRMGDVIELCHPNPCRRQPTDDETVPDRRSALYRHLLDRRHGHFTNHSDATNALKDQGLGTLALAYNLDAVHPDERRQFLRDLGPEALGDAGYTWERLSGWLPGGMDAEAWEAIIPAMGYMALLRNLRNFEEAKVSQKRLEEVAYRLADSTQVARSRQFPFRFWSAYRNSGTMFFGPYLEQALEHSVKNLPDFPGRTLVAVDTSGSMRAPLSANSRVRNVEVAGVFAAALANKNDVDLVIYGDNARRVEPVVSCLRSAETLDRLVGSVGHGTQTWPSVLAAYDGHDRIVVFTDMQDHPAHQRNLPNVPIYVWDLGGYGRSNIDVGTPGRYLFGGFSDASFKLIGLLEAGRDATWPWEH